MHTRILPSLLFAASQLGLRLYKFRLSGRYDRIDGLLDSIKLIYGISKVANVSFANEYTNCAEHVYQLEHFLLLTPARCRPLGT